MAQESSVQGFFSQHSFFNILADFVLNVIVKIHVQDLNSSQ